MKSCNVCLYPKLKDCGLKKATGSESSLTRFRLGASLNTTGNIKPQTPKRVIPRTPTSSPSQSTQWSIYPCMFFKQLFLKVRSWCTGHQSTHFHLNVIYWLADKKREREGEGLRDASLVHNRLEKMKAITLMLLTLGREEWRVIALRVLVLLLCLE